MYLYLYRNPIFDNNAMLSLVLLAMGIVIAFAVFAIRLEGVSVYLVPIAIAPIILTIIFDSRVGLMSTSVLAPADCIYERVTTSSMWLPACRPSSIAVYSVRDIKNRSQFFLDHPCPCIHLLRYHSPGLCPEPDPMPGMGLAAKFCTLQVEPFSFGLTLPV